MKTIQPMDRPLARDGAGDRRGARWSKTGAATVAFAAMTFSATPDAHAQYYGGDSLLPIFVAGVVVESGLVAGGLVMGIGSTVHAARANDRKGWFAGSYVFGGLNLAATILWGAVADGNPSSNGPWVAFAMTHASIAALDITASTVGLVRARPDQQAFLRPVIVGGRDAGGQRWTGVGVQLVGF